MSLLITKNKRAYFDYEILNEYEAGIKLTGQEAKSVRNKHINLKGAYISVQNGICYLKNCSISKYFYSNIQNYDPLRDRVLLLKKKEIDKIETKLNEKGISAVPLDIHIKNNFFKVKIGIGRGKKKYDKRQDLKKKSVDRDIKRELKKFSR